MSFEVILQDVSIGCITEIDIWEKLVHYFSENWDDQDIFQQVKDLSRKQLGRDVDDIKNTSQYFKALENNFSDKNDLLEFIINLTSFLNFHTECGSVNVPEKLQTFRKTLRTFRELCIRRGIFRDKNFVGRESEIENVKTEISGSDGNKGILICGMGGMGKTCLASTICYELRREDWSTTKIELREQRTFWHFLRTTLHSIRDLRGTILGHAYTAKSIKGDDEDNDIDEETMMKQKLIDYLIENKNRKHIYMFDNLDDVTSDKIEKEKVMEFFKTLLSKFKYQSLCMIRIIITSRENFLLTSTDDMKRLMTDIEVKGLDRDSAVDLVRKCTHHGQTVLTTEIMQSVVRICGACPLAIRVICGIMNTSPLALIRNLEKQAASLSCSFLQIHQCLQEPYERLEEYKPILCKLSLFGTAKFDLHSAAMVVYGKQSEEDTKQYQEELQLILLLFKSRHLLEIDNYYTEERGDIEVETTDRTVNSSYKKIFSLHPLVYNFLKEKTKCYDRCEEIKNAKYNFIELFRELVHDIGDAYNTDVLVAREKSEKLKIHILKYIELLGEFEDISNDPALENVLSNEQTTFLSKTIELIYNPQQHLSFLEKMCMKTKEGTKTNISWQVEHMTAMIGYEMPCKDIEEKCNDILEKLNNFENDQLTLIYKSRMLSNKGKIAMEKDDGRDSINIFKEAINILQSKCLSHKRECQIYLAENYNSIGCVFFKTKETEQSMQWHKRALAINDKQKLKNQSTVTYCANLGACHFRLGIEHNRNNEKPKMKTKMEEALKYYHESIALAKHLKADGTDDFAKKLKNRGDVLVMLKRFDEAEADYQMGLKIERKMNSCPNRRQVILQHALGQLVRLQIQDINTKRRRGSFTNREDEEDKTDTIDLSLKGLKVYEELNKIIDVKIMPTDHHDYEKIKSNHLYFLNELHEYQKVKDAEMFYQNYEGRISSTASSPESLSSSSSEGSNDNYDSGNESTDCKPQCEGETDLGAGVLGFSCTDKRPHCSQSDGNNIDQYGTESSWQTQNVTNRQIQDNNSPELKYLEQSRDKIKTLLLQNDNTEVMKRNDNEEAILRINEQKHNFKLPLTTSKSLQGSLFSPTFGLPKKIVTRRGSSSSSGVSSLGTMTPGSERSIIRSARSSRELSQDKSFELSQDKSFELSQDKAFELRQEKSFKLSQGKSFELSQGKSFEDEVFYNRQQTVDKRTDCSLDPGWVKRRKSFGSGPLSEDSIEEPVSKQQKFSTRSFMMTKAASLDMIRTTTPSKQEWLVKDKLSSWFENTTKSCQTDIGNLDRVAGDIESLIPSVKPRMRTLLHKIDSKEAHLIDDEKGRPIVHYNDEGFQEEDEKNK